MYYLFQDMLDYKSKVRHLKIKFMDGSVKTLQVISLFELFSLQSSALYLYLSYLYLSAFVCMHCTFTLTCTGAWMCDIVWMFFVLTFFCFSCYVKCIHVCLMVLCLFFLLFRLMTVTMLVKFWTLFVWKWVCTTLIYYQQTKVASEIFIIAKVFLLLFSHFD